MILPYFKNVSSLSLINCDFLIADFFDGLESDFQLEHLSISQNKNDKQIFNLIKFPKFLSELVLKDIKWEEASLVKFLESLMYHQSEKKESALPNDEIKVNLSYIKMTENEWDIFYEKLALIKCKNIVEFKWDNNIISKQLVFYL